MKKIITLIAILVSCSLPSAALFQDEAGIHDWLHSLVGRPISVHFMRVDKKPRLIVGTQREMVTSLNAKTGDIGMFLVIHPLILLVWRHHLPGLHHVQVVGNGLFKNASDSHRRRHLFQSTSTLGRCNGLHVVGI